MLHRQQVPPEHGAGQRAEQQQAALADLARPVGLGDAVGPRRRVQRVQLSGQARPERDGGTAQRLRHGRPFPLRITRDVDPVPEGDRPQREGLGQRRLALPDHPGKEHVGVGEPLDLAVQRERVEAETGFGVDVAADVDALGAEAAFGEKRVRPARGSGGHAVGGQLEPVVAGGRGAGSPGGWEEGRRHLLFCYASAAGVGGCFEAGLRGGLGEPPAGSLTGRTIGAVRGEQGAGAGAAGAARRPVAHDGRLSRDGGLDAARGQTTGEAVNRIGLR